MSSEDSSSPAAPPARSVSPPKGTAPTAMDRSAVVESSISNSPAPLVYGASKGRHQNRLQPTHPRTRGSSRAANPKSWGTSSSARKAPMGPMKLRAGPVVPALKNGAGSDGLYVPRLIRSIRDKPKDRSPRNSASRRFLASLAMGG